MKITALLLVGLLLAATSMKLPGREPATTLREIAGFADWIFIGRVTEVGDGAAVRDIYGPASVLEVEVLQEICGKPFAIGLPPGRLQLLYRPEHLERPGFARGKSFVFFWKNTVAGPILAPGHYGALELEDGTVSTRLLEGSAAETPLADFVAALNCGA